MRKQPSRPEPSPAEWDVLQAVWELTEVETEVAVSELRPKVFEKRDWSNATVKSTLDRLVKKGYLSSRIRGKTCFYRPIVPKEEVTHRSIRTFIDTVLGGAFGPLVAYLADQKGLTKKQVEELEQLLVEEEGKKP